MDVLLSRSTHNQAASGLPSSGVVLEDVIKLSVQAPDCSCDRAVPRPASLPARYAQRGYSEPPVEHRAGPPHPGGPHGLGAERQRRIFDKLQEAGPREGKAERKRPGKRREAAAGGAAPPPPVRAAGASGSSARAAGRLTWHSQPRATRRRRRRGARSAGRAEQVPGTPGAGGGEGDGEAGEPQVRRARGAAALRSVHKRLHRDSPSTWLPGSPERERAGNISRENGNSSVRLRDIIRGRLELVPGDSGQGRVCLWNPSALGLDPRRSLPSGFLPCRRLQLSQVSATWCSG